MEQKVMTKRERVLALISEHEDFPALSTTITLMNGMNSSNDVSVNHFSNLILKDYALTCKIIHMVNSTAYAHFGEITTVSRAVFVMGLETIKNMAIALKMFDHFRDRVNTDELKDLMLKALASAVIARHVSESTGVGNEEEAFLCSLFHTFGTVLVAFYLPDDYSEIRKLIHENGATEESASRSVLGISLVDIGMHFAKLWHFPERMVLSMKPARIPLIRGETPEEQLTMLSILSHGITAAITEKKDHDDKKKAIEKLVKSYRGFSEIEGEKIEGFLTSSVSEIEEYSNIFDLNITDSPFMKHLEVYIRQIDMTDEGSNGSQDAGSEALVSLDSPRCGQEESSDSVFTRGIQEVTNALFGSYELNDILRIGLETMFRGLNFAQVRNVIFFIKDVRSPHLCIRFGFGSDIDHMKIWFRIPLVAENDIFSLATTKQKDLLIKDTEDASIRQSLPQWYRSRARGRMFLILLPITIQMKPIGLFYIEGSRDGCRHVTESHLNFLKIIRDQTVQAIKRKIGG